MAGDTSERRESARAVGPARMAIIRAILHGNRHRSKLQGAVKELAKGETFCAMLERMVEDGLIVSLRGGMFAATDKARALAIPAPPPMVPYVAPPPSWRRPGSDHSHIPSLAGGQLITRR